MKKVRNIFMYWYEKIYNFYLNLYKDILLNDSYKIYLPTYVLSIHLPTYLSVCPPFYLTIMTKAHKMSGRMNNNNKTLTIIITGK